MADERWVGERGVVRLPGGHMAHVEPGSAEVAALRDALARL